MAKTFRVVTYNVHKCQGLDGKVRPDRIVQVLREVDADIVGLQEVWSAETGSLEDHQANYIARGLEMHANMGENRRLNGGAYGNLLLSRLPVRGARNYDISKDGRERRGCQRADIEIAPGRLAHVFNLHLGTAFFERRYQGEKLIGGDILDNGELEGPRIVMGDFNEWTRGLASRLLSAHLVSPDLREHLGRGATYPGLLPFLHLDHIYHDPALRLERLTLQRGKAALVASDHLPLVADFRVPEAAVRG